MCWESHSHLVLTFIYADAVVAISVTFSAAFFPHRCHVCTVPCISSERPLMCPTRTCAPCLHRGTCTHGSAENGAISTQPGPISTHPWDGGDHLPLPGAIRHRVLLPWGQIWGSSRGVNALGAVCARCPCQDLRTPPAHRSSLGRHSPLEV